MVEFPLLPSIPCRPSFHPSASLKFPPHKVAPPDVIFPFPSLPAHPSSCAQEKAVLGKEEMERR
ncbi:hypothetical protein BO83DRAFT_378131 [Aspergillus eucalypticola CBS 122712]|uniref:Uncharacterized protein n=1 Tax=Aspergillus eucalypticola (strain CBS 122712 / IBT 29274) TaxID=1448314 RepID=A0A317VLN1_ASPEC|nr:uncharacterized protein BO83DRAFT_378131 [Aspergillus eucalypticola CBS 122712]PWY74037.1 hypothetical protein BO83DRAFT_378131 [Aspergillus eucalypticola CBS 122712]